MAEIINVGERLRIPLKFLDDQGVAQPVENPKTSSSDETVAVSLFDTNGDLLIRRIAPGTATITVGADADVSPVNDVEISNTLDVEVPASMAKNVVFGGIIHEPDPG